MADELVDATFIDRHTNVDNILMEKLLPVLEKLQTGDITVQMSGDEGEDTLQKLLDVAVKQYNDDNEIIFFSHPNDGTRAEILTGTTILNYRHGTIKDTTGLITRMSSSLTDQKKDFLRSLAINSDKEIIVQLDENDSAPIKADTWTSMTFQQFEKLTITTTETTNVFVYACTNPKHAMQYASESTVSIGREERSWAVTDKDTHFTGAIAQNVNEKENLTGLSSNEITINSIILQSDQALNYRLWLFGTDGFDDTDLDDDKFMDFVNLDLVTNNNRLGAANQYYYAVNNLDKGYSDLDETNELHIALENLSATAKNAGATGEVAIRFQYTPRR